MTSRLPDLDALLSPADDDERREGDWLRARDDDPAASPPSEAVARDQAELAELLATMPVGRDDDRWQDAVLAAAHAESAAAKAAPRARRVRWGRLAMAGGALAAALLAIYLAIRPGDAPVAELQVAVNVGGSSRGSAGEVAVGDQLVVRARPRGATELRVYQGQQLLLRCPGAPGCADGDRSWRVDVRLAAPVRHRVILVFGDVQVPPDAPLDRFLDAARAARVRMIIHPAIDVH